MKLDIYRLADEIFKLAAENSKLRRALLEYVLADEHAHSGQTALSRAARRALGLGTDADPEG